MDLSSDSNVNDIRDFLFGTETKSNISEEELLKDISAAGSNTGASHKSRSSLGPPMGTVRHFPHHFRQHSCHLDCHYCGALLEVIIA